MNWLLESEDFEDIPCEMADCHVCLANNDIKIALELGCCWVKSVIDDD